MARQLSTRERRLLVFVVLAGIVFFVYRLRGSELIFGGGAPPAKKDDKPLPPAPRVQMDLLAQRTRDYDPDGRDLFKYYTPPPPRIAAPPPMPIEAPQFPPPQPIGPPRPQAPMVVNTGPPPPPFQYIGLVGSKDARIAVFQAGPELLYAQAGETVQGRYRVLEFKYEAVVLSYEEARFKGKTVELAMKGKK